MKLAELTYEEVESLCKGGRAVAIVPVGSVEPHGPHLPLHTDTIIATLLIFAVGFILGSREPKEETETYHFQGFDPWYAN